MLLSIKQLKIGTYGIFAFLIIALATLLRIFLIAWGWPHSNSDVDTMGIMAMHIAYKGEHPMLFFGSLSMLLASWLALSYDQYSSPNRRLWRSIAYGCWGLAAGLGFWSDFLMLVFILLSGLLLVLFCWRELLQFAVLPLVSGLIIGSFPLIMYNLNAPPGENTFAVLRYLHNNGSLQLAQLQVHNHIPLEPELQGTMLTSLPAAIGGTPFCFDAYTHFRFAGYLGTENVSCSIVHGNLSLIATALVWSLAFFLLC